MRSTPVNVVIIEDDSVFRRGLVRLFEKQECSVSGFDNAADALKFILSGTTDFVVCDFKLPGMNGLEMLDELRNESCKTPFVLVTAHYSEDLNAQALASGALAAIPKPLDIVGLRGIFEKELELN